MELWDVSQVQAGIQADWQSRSRAQMTQGKLSACPLQSALQYSLEDLVCRRITTNLFYFVPWTLMLPELKQQWIQHCVRTFGFLVAVVLSLTV